MPTPSSDSASMLLAKELCDAKGATATAASMIHEDPDGTGAAPGRELLAAIGK